MKHYTVVAVERVYYRVEVEARHEEHAEELVREIYGDGMLLEENGTSEFDMYSIDEIEQGGNSEKEKD